MKEKLFRFIIGHKALVVVILAVITLLFAWSASGIKFDNTIEAYFFEKDVKQLHKFLDQFGTDEIIAVAFKDKDIFTSENLHLIDTISKKMEKMAHVRRVLSLTTTKIVYGDEESAYFDHLIKKIPDSPDAMAPIKERAYKDPFIPGILISKDGTKAAIVAQIDHIIGTFDYKVKLIKQIKELLKEEEAVTGKQFKIAGTAILDEAVLRYSEKDQSFFMPIMVVFMLLIVFLMFRSIIMVILPILVVILSVVWTYGFLVLLGYKINIISTIIPPLLMAIAIADSIHLISGYSQEIARGNGNKMESIKKTFVHLITPCFMTSITTFFGLLSLQVSDLYVLEQFGLVAAGGVVFAFIITILLLPVLFSICPPPKEKHHEKFRTGLSTKLLNWLGNWQKPKAIIILGITALIFIIIAPSIPKLTVGTNSLDYFKKNDIVRKQVEWIDANIGGTVSLEFFIDAGKEDAFKDPALLGKIEQLENYLEKTPGITGAYSAVDLVKSLNRAYNEGDEAKFVIPSSAAEIAQYLLLVEGSRDIKELLSDDYSRARISARVIMNRSLEVSHHMTDIMAEVHRLFGDAVTVEPTGILYLMSRMEHYLLTSQIKSFVLAFVIIFILIVLMLRSFKIGIFAIIPNFLPIAFTIAIMSILGIPLDVGTVMIACIALGLVVDDTIHFLSRLKLELETANDTHEGIAKSMTNVGRPIVYTSIILSLGLLVLAFASFSPVVHFGFLSSIVIILALLFDLLVLPAIMGFTRLKDKKSPTQQ